MKFRVLTAAALALAAIAGPSLLSAQTPAAVPRAAAPAPVPRGVTPASVPPATAPAPVPRGVTPASVPPATAPATVPATTGVWETEAQTFVKDLLSQLSAAAKQGGAAQAEQQRLEAILARKLAVKRMGAFLLGNASAAATPEQLAEYNRLVPTYMAHAFAERIEDLVNQKFEFGAAQTRSPREVIVSSSFARKGGQGTVRVNWRLIKEANQIQVLDVSVNGVPALAVQREDFASLVKRGGFEALLARLRSMAGA